MIDLRAKVFCYTIRVDQEELELEQNANTLAHARFVALVLLVLLAVGLYVASFFFSVLR